MVYIFLRFISAVILKILFRLQVRGKEYLPKKGGFILASNHVSFLDPVALGVACPRKANFMGRDDLFSKRWSSWLLYHCRTFPVKRDSADLSALKEAMHRLKAGQILVLFPEGSRSMGDVSSEAQAGIGFLAYKTQVPVVPAFIKGSREAWPKGAKFFHPHQISITFGTQISMERRMPYEDFAHLVMEHIRHLSC